MTDPTFQTMRLSRGKHSSPRYGACAMEFASMLAGEPFSDRPRSVSPVISAFMRGYNDLLDDRRRQDLLGYVSDVVGSAGTEETEQARARRLIEWADEHWQARPGPGPLGRFGRLRPWRAAHSDAEGAGMYAVRSIRPASGRSHSEALELLDELIAIGREPDAQWIAAPRRSPRSIAAR